MVNISTPFGNQGSSVCMVTDIWTRQPGLQEQEFASTQGRNSSVVYSVQIGLGAAHHFVQCVLRDPLPRVKWL